MREFGGVIIMFDNFITKVRTRLGRYPAITHPKRDSAYERFISQYNWGFKQGDKALGEWSAYRKAEENVYVDGCIRAYENALTSRGFTIKNKTDNVEDTATVSYLNRIFNNPEGQFENATFSSLSKQIIRSKLLAGDAFVEVDVDEAFDNVLNGFHFIPPELVYWDNETSQWSIRGSDVHYEPSEIIHVYEPSIWLKGSRFGVSPIDKIGLVIGLLYSSLRYNKDLLESDSLDPNGILSFDKDISRSSMIAEMERLGNLPPEKRRGMLTLHGATYQTARLTSRDIDYEALMKFCRDMILTAYHVPPQKVEIIETASLGTGTGESQNEDWKQTVKAEANIIEDAFNKVLGRHGFREVFEYNELDFEDKLKRAQVEQIQLNSGVKSINEIRDGYGLNHVDWGDVPMNYTNYGVINPFSASPVSQLGADNVNVNAPTSTITQQKSVHAHHDHFEGKEMYKQILENEGLIRR